MATAPWRSRLAGILTAPLALGLTLAWTSHAGAAPLTRDKVPEPLRPWIDWVLRGHEEAACPFFAGAPTADAGGQQEEAAPERRCLWPSRLDLELADHGGRFGQDWMLYDEEWVPLPGDAKSWPQE